MYALISLQELLCYLVCIMRSSWKIFWNTALQQQTLCNNLNLRIISDYKLKMWSEHEWQICSVHMTPCGKGKKDKVVSRHYAMKTYGEVDVQIHVFLTLTLVGGEWSASRPCHLTPGERALGNKLDRRLGGPQSWPGWYGEAKIFHPRIK
jgi:hypothetical protein